MKKAIKNKYIIKKKIETSNKLIDLFLVDYFSKIISNHLLNLSEISNNLEEVLPRSTLGFLKDFTYPFTVSNIHLIHNLHISQLYKLSKVIVVCC